MSTRYREKERKGGRQRDRERGSGDTGLDYEVFLSCRSCCC